MRISPSALIGSYIVLPDYFPIHELFHCFGPVLKILDRSQREHGNGFDTDSDWSTNAIEKWGVPVDHLKSGELDRVPKGRKGKEIDVILRQVPTEKIEQTRTLVTWAAYQVDKGNAKKKNPVGRKSAAQVEQKFVWRQYMFENIAAPDIFKLCGQTFFCQCTLDVALKIPSKKALSIRRGHILSIDANGTGAEMPKMGRWNTATDVKNCFRCDVRI